MKEIVNCGRMERFQIRARLYLELEKFVAQSNGYYVSVAEVVREALRDYLKKQHEE